MSQENVDAARRAVDAWNRVTPNSVISETPSSLSAVSALEAGRAGVPVGYVFE